MTVGHDPRIISRFGFSATLQLSAPKNLNTKELTWLDPWEFCRVKSVVGSSGSVSAASACVTVGKTDLPRFGEQLLNHPDDLVWAITGFVNKSGHCVMHLTGSFSANRGCMRCGEPISETVSFDRYLRLCKSEQEADEADASVDEDEGESVDFVAAPGKINLLEWLEDELLLSLPMFVRHDDCEVDPAVEEFRRHALLDDGVKPSEEHGEEVSGSHNPFAVLASLKKSRN